MKNPWRYPIFLGMICSLLSEWCAAASFHQRSVNHVAFYFPKLFLPYPVNINLLLCSSTKLYSAPQYEIIAGTIYLCSSAVRITSRSTLVFSATHCTLPLLEARTGWHHILMSIAIRMLFQYSTTVQVLHNSVPITAY